MAKNLMDYVGKKFQDRIEAVIQMPDYWDEEDERYHHMYKISCKEGYAFDTGGSIDKEGYVETVSQISPWIKEFVIQL